MRQDAAKSFSADFAFADVFVAIDAAAERDFRIVDVEDRDATEADGAVDQVDRRGKTSFALNVVARGEEMRGVETRGCGNIFQACKNFGKLFKARADSEPHACRVLDEDAQVAEGYAFRALLDGFDDIGDGLLGCGFAARAGMNDQKIGAEGYAADEFIVKSLDGARSQHGLGSGQIDQIVRVND